MAVANNTGRMAQFTKGTGSMIWLVEQEGLSTLMEMFTKDYG